MNKTFSKILSLVLAVMLTVGMVTFADFTIEADAMTYGDWEYSIYFDEYASITKYNGTDAVVEVPSVLGNRPVRVIGREAFRENKTLVEVTVPSSVETIREYAFIKCESLKTVNLSDGLVSLYNNIFDFTAVERLNIPSTVTMFALTGFWDLQLKEIVFEKEFASHCSISVNLVDFPETAELVFKGIPSVSIDSKLQELGMKQFYEDGTYRYKIYNNDDETVLTSGDYQYTLNQDGATIVRYNDFDNEEVVVPNKIDGHPVVAVGDFAFSQATEAGEQWWGLEYEYTYNFKKVILPEGIKTIGSYAFAGDNNLVEVIVPESLEHFGYCSFLECKSLESVNVPQGVEVLPDGLFYNKFSSSKISTKLPDSLKVICDKAICFTGIEDYSVDVPEMNANLPDSVEYLGDALFHRCIMIEEITLPKNLKEMHGTFVEMYELKRINFNDCLRVIGKKSFYACSNLEEVILPESVTEIGSSAFNSCYKLSKAYVPASVTNIPYRAFYDCQSLDILEWNPAEKIIGEDAFYGCPLRGFDFTDTHGISDRAFYGSSIEAAKIGKGDYEPEEKQYIGAQSFMCCSELQTVSLGGNVNEIGSQAFADCENLETVVIADSVEKIADDAFDGSEKVTIFCWEDSYAENYAKKQKIKVTTLVIDPISNQTYTTKEIKPALTVSMSSQKLNKSDYTADFYNNVNVGTASVVVTGKGDFDMLVSKADFAIVAKNIADVQISSIPSQKYEDSAVTPEVSLKHSGQKLQEGKDYSITYENNNSVGTGTVRIKGLGNYKGTATLNFEIKETNTSPIVQFFNAIADFFITVFNWFIGIFK